MIDVMAKKKKPGTLASLLSGHKTMRFIYRYWQLLMKYNMHSGILLLGLPLPLSKKHTASRWNTGWHGTYSTGPWCCHTHSVNNNTATS